VKWLLRNFDTARPTSVGRKLRLSISTYLRNSSVWMIDGVGRRTADAVFLERLDQRRFGEARRRLGEMLVGVDAIQRHAVAGLHRRQLAAFVLVVGSSWCPCLPRTRRGSPDR
jgi:hypothetical protein